MLYNYKSGFNSLIRKRNEDHSPKTNKLFETKQQSLVNFLYKKYSIKYNLKSENKDLRSEIANYTKHMDSSSDLANLDKIIANMFAMPRSSSLKETGKKIISTYNDNEIDKIVERNNINLIEEKKELVINEDRINQSRESLMSGASQLSQFASSLGRKKDQENRRNQIKTLVSKVNNKEGEEKLKLEGNEWSLLAEYNRIQFIKDKENISKMKKKKQEILKKELDIQLKEKNLFRKKEKEEREMYGKMVIARVDDFKRQQKLDKIENFRKSVELKETRDKLLEDDRIRKKQDLINIRTKEQEVVNISKHMQEEEFKLIMTKKQLEKNIFKKSLEEQKMLDEIKNDNRIKEKLLDKQLEKESKANFEKVEFERKKHRNRITKSYDGVYDIMSKLNSKRENEIKEFEENFVDKYSQKYSKIKDNQNEVQDYNKKKELKEYLDKQVNYKKEIKRNEYLKDKEYGNYLEEVKNKFVEDSKNELLKKRNINIENNHAILKQIEDKKGLKNNNMNLNEFSMNKDILSNVYRENSLYK